MTHAVCILYRLLPYVLVRALSGLLESFPHAASIILIRIREIFHHLVLNPNIALDERTHQVANQFVSAPNPQRLCTYPRPA